ncbi:MAG: hypothetical protein WC008_03565 [Bacilli bacterium]
MNKLDLKKYYILIFYLIGLVNWFFKLDLLYLISLLIFTGFITYKNIDRRLLIPIIIAVPFMHYNPDFSVLSIIIGLIIAVILVLDIIKYQMYTINNIIKAMFIILVLMMFSLFYTISFELSMLGISKFLIYTVLLVYFYNIKSDKKDIIINSFIYISFIIVLQIFIYFITNLQFDFLENLSKLTLGWGSYNVISYFFLSTIILSSIKYIQTYKNRYLILIFLMISFSILTLTKGTYIAIVIISVPYLMNMYNDSKKNPYLVKQFILYVIIALLFRLFVSNPLGITLNWYDRIGRGSVSQDGIDVLLSLGLDVVKMSPIVGLGANISSLFISNVYFIYDPNYFPNFIIQTMATLGLIGLCGVGYYLFAVIKTLLKKSCYNKYVLLIFLVIIIQSLFDTSIFSGIVMITLSILLSNVEEEKKGVA